MNEITSFISTTDVAMRYFPGNTPRYARKLFTNFIKSDAILLDMLVSKTNYNIRQRYLSPRQQRIINDYFAENLGDVEL